GQDGSCRQGLWDPDSLNPPRRLQAWTHQEPRSATLKRRNCDIFVSGQRPRKRDLARAALETLRRSCYLRRARALEKWTGGTLLVAQGGILVYARNPSMA